MLKKVCVLCSGLLTSMAMISTTHAAGNTITLEATVSSVCEVSFANDNKIAWELNPTQEDGELVTLKQDVVIKFTGCPQGSATPMYLTSSAVTKDDCVEASNIDNSAQMQFCFKDDVSGDDITVFLDQNNIPQARSNVIDASRTKLGKAVEEASRTIQVYPRLVTNDENEGNPLVEGTYTGFVTVVSNIN